MAGKLKMAFQCFAIVAILIVFREGGETTAGRGLVVLRDGLMMIALLLTIYSGWAYLMRARSIFAGGSVA